MAESTSNPAYLVTADGPRALGRHTQATQQHWAAISKSMPVAPRVFSSAGLPVPRRSPDVRRFHYDLFLDQRQRGMCVGFNTAGVIMTRLRIPPGATETVGDPLPEVALSPIFIYDLSRIEARSEGYLLGFGDGAIGSCAARGCARWGVCDWADDPANPAVIDSHQNDSRPPPEALTFGLSHHVKSFALCDSFEHALEMNAAGWPLAVCSEIPRSMLTTGLDGSFRMVGAAVGGHCYQFLDHDRDLDLAWIGQSWANWGEQSDDPKYADRDGYTQIGTCPLSELGDWFSPMMMASGASEVICYNTIEGFDQVIATDQPDPSRPTPKRRHPLKPRTRKPKPK